MSAPTLVPITPVPRSRYADPPRYDLARGTIYGAVAAYVAALAAPHIPTPEGYDATMIRAGLTIGLTALGLWLSNTWRTVAHENGWEPQLLLARLAKSVLVWPLLFCLVAGGPLACATTTPPTPQQRYDDALRVYDAADTIAAAYLASGLADPKTAAELRTAEGMAWNAKQAAAQALATGNTPELEAALALLAAESARLNAAPQAAPTTGGAKP